MDWAGTAFLLVGLWLTGNRNRLGFLSGALGCILWIAYSIERGPASLLLATAAFLCIHWRNWRRWRSAASN